MPDSIELLCLAQFLRCARRHRRYLTVMLLVYMRALFWPRGSRALRTGFCFLQLADDLLDGDAPSAEDADAVVARAAAEIRAGRYGTGTLSRLAQAFMADLGHAREEVLELLDAMRFDRRRALQGLLSDAEDLRAHHRRTFRLSLALLLKAARAELGPGDAPELIEAFGWCSTMRDLDEDLSRGLVNVPRLVALAAAAAGSPWTDRRAFIASPPVRAWATEERLRAVDLLAASRASLPALRGRRGAEILALFERSMSGFARRLESVTPAPYPKVCASR
ncbi:MAG: hypothetical protein HYZ75_12835 [Elusimicrobia bacterium]|nr:hypothetical protein [Elusimicrobiota bacterium]